MTKVNPNNGNETNKIFFHGTYSNLPSYSFLGKNIKLFQRLSKSKFPSIVTKVNAKQWNIFFNATYSNLRSVVIDHKILKYFNDFNIVIFQVHCKSEHEQVK